jgi:hypothetical protein
MDNDDLLKKYLIPKKSIRIFKLSMKDMMWIVIILFFVFFAGFQVGMYTHPLININTNIASGNYSFEIGNNLHNILNKNHTTISETNSTGIYSNFTMRTVST